MTIYARPGTTGSIVPLRTRYDNFIGGEWVRPVKLGYAEDLAPATGLAIAEYARSTEEDVFGGHKQSGYGRETDQQTLNNYQEVENVLDNHDQKPLGFFA